MAGTSRYISIALPFTPSYSSPQVEYALKAVENGGTAIGIRCKDGVVLALEKLVSSKLLKPSANKRIATVDRNIGLVRLSSTSR
jgi:20S proteasome subunit alpha 7